MASRTPRTAGTIVVVCFLLGAALLLWPRALGGSVSFITLHGTSMNPRFTAGDMVVLRANPDPQIGDIVAYRSEQGGTFVLHRIIARNGDRYVFKGDNNTWTDSEQPAAGALEGELWFRVPGGGKLVGWLSGPWRAGLFGGGMAAMTILGLAGGRKNQETAGKRTAPTPRPRFRLRLAIRHGAARLFPIAIGVALCSGALLAYAMTGPTTVSVARELRYEQRADFSYSGPVTIPGAYDRGEIDTGDPAFRNLTEYVDVVFDYHLGTSAAPDISGTIHLTGVVHDITGWHRTFELSPTQTFYTTQGRATARVELQGLFDALQAAEALTGRAPVYFTAAVIAEVWVAGTLDGRPFQEDWAPYFTFRVDPPNQLYVETTETRLLEKLAPSGADRADNPFHQALAGTIPFESPAPRTISIAGQSLSIENLRVLGAVGLAGALLAAVVSAVALMALKRHQPTLDDLLAENADAVFDVRREQLKPSGLLAVTLESPAELFRLAAYLDKPVLRERDLRGRVLVVHDRECTYLAETGEEENSS